MTEASHEPIEAVPKVREAFAGSASTATSKFSLAVSWENISYSVKMSETKTIDILKGLTGTALPGRSLAIMGSSGAGKTTFLNALANRLRADNTHQLNGTMRLNDVPFERRYRKVLGFVTQEDIVSSMATPEDAFRFSLRIRRGTTPEETDRRVEDMLEELKLTHVRNTLVGIPGIVSGLSGGEKKRTNIGVELIGDPKVLLLDEPTSGLDSVTASRIVGVCRELAQKGRTVIFTIHQPTADCISYFDDLMLMCVGGVAYHGTMADSIEYFSAAGYPCPDNYTPTDYYMILLQDPAIGPALVERWAKHIEGGHSSAHVVSPTANAAHHLRDAVDNAVLPEAGETHDFLENYIASTGSPVSIQFAELMKRSFQNVGRNKMFIAMSFIQGVFFAIVCGIIFVNLKDDVPGMQDRLGLLFMVVTNKCFGGAMMMINTFPADKAVFIREQHSGSYSPAIYFLTKSLAELPVQAMSQILESIIIYFMTGLVTSPGRFFHYLAICFAVYQASTGLGMAISCSVPSLQLASGLAPLAMIPMMLAGGLLGSVDRLRPAWVWLEKISVVRYAYILLLKNEMNGIDHIDCYPNSYSDLNGTAFCARQPVTGRALLDSYEFNGVSHADWLMWVCLVAWIIVMRIVAVLALNRIAHTKE